MILTPFPNPKHDKTNSQDPQEMSASASWSWRRTWKCFCKKQRHPRTNHLCAVPAESIFAPFFKGKLYMMLLNFFRDKTHKSSCLLSLYPILDHPLAHSLSQLFTFPQRPTPVLQVFQWNMMFPHTHHHRLCLLLSFTHTQQDLSKTSSQHSTTTHDTTQHNTLHNTSILTLCTHKSVKTFFDQSNPRCFCSFSPQSDDKSCSSSFFFLLLIDPQHITREYRFFYFFLFRFTTRADLWKSHQSDLS